MQESFEDETSDVLRHERDLSKRNNKSMRALTTSTDTLSYCVFDIAEI